MALKVIGSGLGPHGHIVDQAGAGGAGLRPHPPHGRGVHASGQRAAVGRGRQRPPRLGRDLRRLRLDGGPSGVLLLAPADGALSGRQGAPHRARSRTSGSTPPRRRSSAPTGPRRPKARRCRPFFDQLNAWYGGDMHDRAFMTDFFRRHTEAVLAGVPKDRLLVFQVSDGWGPLCDFLGVPGCPTRRSPARTARRSSRRPSRRRATPAPCARCWTRRRSSSACGNGSRSAPAVFVLDGQGRILRGDPDRSAGPRLFASGCTAGSQACPA